MHLASFLTSTCRGKTTIMTNPICIGLAIRIPGDCEQRLKWFGLLCLTLAEEVTRWQAPLGFAALLVLPSEIQVFQSSRKEHKKSTLVGAREWGGFWYLLQTPINCWASKFKQTINSSFLAGCQHSASKVPQGWIHHKTFTNMWSPAFRTTPLPVAAR